MMKKQDLSHDPILQFTRWFVEANDRACLESNAFSLATCSKEGLPSVRTVLLKAYDANGFVFFTNYQSRKSIELDENPKAALLFFWRELKRQVTIEGEVKKCSPEQSQTYFASRPIESQIGAWASLQDQPLTNREELDVKFEERKEEFKNKSVPLPPWWGGYILVPHRFEFWQEGLNRLHDRIEYQIGPEGIFMTRLSP